jgi:hypothetical protein
MKLVLTYSAMQLLYPYLASQELWSALANFFLNSLSIFLISALSMVWDCPFKLIEPIWMHKIVPWSFFVLITLPRNENQATHARFRVCARVFTLRFC